MFTEEFGSLKWSNDENYVLYSAEKLVKKKEYYDPELDWNDAKNFFDSNVVSELRICRLVIS